MTKAEHIGYWVETAQNDWVAVESMFETKNYLHCLFWAHLVLEKLAKAHWVKTHEDNIPPKVHNVVWLLEESNVDLGEDMKDFLEGFNKFQLSGRYPDYTKNIYKMCTKEFTYTQLEKTKEIRQCLIEML
ncbi:MAG: HEPN domain-containing protein [Prevotellaceae bacterium]|jgi:HEPN domain-containing protein|nr:HEPN domain-containing protein [Prevotellaceae bacterium]